MTAQPLAPVIASWAVPAARRRAGLAAGRPLSLARPVRSALEGVDALARLLNAELTNEQTIAP